MASFLNPNKVYADELTNQALGALTQFTNAYNKAEEERVRSSLINMQARYDEDQNNLMLQLQQTNDTDEMNKLVTNFQSEHVSNMKNKDSPYYCKTEFEAKKAKEMFDSQNVALQGKVAGLVLQKTNEQTIANDQDSINRYKKLEVGQQGIDKVNSIYGQWYKTGKIKANEYASLKLEAASYFASKDYDNHVASIVDQAIKENKGSAWIKEQIDNYEKNTGNSYHYINSSGVQQDLDTQAIKDQAFKTASQNYTVKLHEYQDGNTNTLSNLYTDLMKSDDPEQQLSICKQGLNLLDRWNGNQITSTTRNEYARYFKNIQNELSKGGKLGGNGESSIATLENLLKNEKQNYLELTKSGVYTAEEGLQAFQNVMLDHLKNGDAKGYGALTEDAAKNILSTYNSEFLTFYDDYIDLVFKDDTFGTTKALLKQLGKDISAHPKEYPDTTIGYLASNLYDLSTTADLSNFSDKELSEKVQGWANACYGDRAEALLKNKKYSPVTVGRDERYDFNKASDRQDYMTQMSDLSAKNDVVYSGPNNTLHYKGENDEKAINSYKLNVQEEVGKALGVAPGKLDVKLKRDSTGDETPTPIVTDPSTGKTYEVKPVYNDKGTKAIDYEIAEIDSKGNKIGTVNKYDWKQDQKDRQKEAKEYQKQTSAAKKTKDKERLNYEEEQAQKYADKNFTDLDTSEKDGIAKSLYKKSWSELNAEQKAKVEENYNNAAAGRRAQMVRTK